MATKKLEAPAAEPKTESKALVSWEEKMAKMAKETASQERVGGNVLSLRAGILSFMGEAVKNNVLNAVILDSAVEHSYYDVKYDADNIVPPRCFAVGRVGEDMVPHEDVPEDQRQSDRCATCPKHAFGSADNGKGRACSVRRRLLLMPADQLKSDDITKAEVGLLKIPPTSVQLWAKYVNRINALHQRPPFGVVTAIAPKPHMKFQFQVHFEDVALVSEDHLDDVYNLATANEGMLMAPFDMSRAEEDEEEEAPVVKGKAAAGKKKY